MIQLLYAELISIGIIVLLLFIMRIFFGVNIKAFWHIPIIIGVVLVALFWFGIPWIARTFSIVWIWIIVGIVAGYFIIKILYKAIKKGSLPKIGKLSENWLSLLATIIVVGGTIFLVMFWPRRPVIVVNGNRSTITRVQPEGPSFHAGVNHLKKGKLYFLDRIGRTGFNPVDEESKKAIIFVKKVGAPISWKVRFLPDGTPEIFDSNDDLSGGRYFFTPDRNAKIDIVLD